MFLLIFDQKLDSISTSLANVMGESNPSNLETEMKRRSWSLNKLQVEGSCSIQNQRHTSKGGLSLFLSTEHDILQRTWLERKETETFCQTRISRPHDGGTAIFIQEQRVH